VPIAPSPRFSPETLKFLRALTRHNDREWFKARKDAYERHVRGPMISVVERLALEFPRFAPDLVASPTVSLFRPYRDTRFSEDKKPLKTHISAVFPCRGLARHEGAALYLEVNCERVFLGGGLYAPQTAQLNLIRMYVAENFVRFKALVESPSFVRAFGEVEGERLQRVPRGFLPDHPAARYLKQRQFLATREYPPEFAFSPRFYPTVLRLFEQAAPMVMFLNEPLLAPQIVADPLSTADGRRYTQIL
jgi:uncharacterized protein (TIGR02453 family)